MQSPNVSSWFIILDEVLKGVFSKFHKEECLFLED
jgi:hypothetical protein